MSTSSPYMIIADTGIALLFFTFIMLALILFIIYSLYPVKGSDNIIN